MTVQRERINFFGGNEASGDYILYWMQQSQRSIDNHALEFAIDEANKRTLPLVVCFAVTDSYPEANLRHYTFMLEGISETKKRLANRGIPMIIRRGNPEDIVSQLTENAVLLVTDCGYLRIQKAWRNAVRKRCSCPYVQVESDVIVPLEYTSNKEEYSAATCRPKVRRCEERFLVPLCPRKLHCDSMHFLDTLCCGEDPDQLAQTLNVDRSVSPVSGYTGGTGEALQRLDVFVREKLPMYADERNDPSLEIQSGMSPYLHFGQISPLTIALNVKEAHVPDDAKKAFLEELIVRRELAANFVHFNPKYDSYEGIPQWARTTLDDHREDPRTVTYSRDEMEFAQTDDTYWNHAQLEMTKLGKMHNYMRMYWGKKIMEWSPSPEEAFERMLFLNNKYELDGRDPNGFAGVAWCFGKHDRPWAEREIFGKVRYMNAKGLERKFRIGNYVARVAKAIEML